MDAVRPSSMTSSYWDSSINSCTRSASSDSKPRRPPRTTASSSGCSGIGPDAGELEHLAVGGERELRGGDRCPAELPDRRAARSTAGRRRCGDPCGRSGVDTSPISLPVSRAGPRSSSSFESGASSTTHASGASPARGVVTILRPRATTAAGSHDAMAATAAARAARESFCCAAGSSASTGRIRTSCSRPSTNPTTGSLPPALAAGICAASRHHRRPAPGRPVSREATASMCRRVHGFSESGSRCRSRR